MLAGVLPAQRRVRLSGVSAALLDPLAALGVVRRDSGPGDLEGRVLLLGELVESPRRGVVRAEAEPRAYVGDCCWWSRCVCFVLSKRVREQLSRERRFFM